MVSSLSDLLEKWYAKILLPVENGNSKPVHCKPLFQHLNGRMGRLAENPSQGKIYAGYYYRYFCVWNLIVLTILKPLVGIQHYRNTVSFKMGSSKPNERVVDMAIMRHHVGIDEPPFWGLQYIDDIVSVCLSTVGVRGKVTHPKEVLKYIKRDLWMVDIRPGLTVFLLSIICLTLML